MDFADEITREILIRDTTKELFIRGLLLMRDMNITLANATDSVLRLLMNQRIMYETDVSVEKHISSIGKNLLILERQLTFRLDRLDYNTGYLLWWLVFFTVVVGLYFLCERRAFMKFHLF